MDHLASFPGTCSSNFSQFQFPCPAICGHPHADLCTCASLLIPPFSRPFRSQVAGIEKIVSSPALLESTSTLFAYGLDHYFTRVSPSNQFDILSGTSTSRFPPQLPFLSLFSPLFPPSLCVRPPLSLRLLCARRLRILISYLDSSPPSPSPSANTTQRASTRRSCS